MRRRMQVWEERSREKGAVRRVTELQQFRGVNSNGLEWQWRMYVLEYIGTINWRGRSSEARGGSGWQQAAARRRSPEKRGGGEEREGCIHMAPAARTHPHHELEPPE